MDKEEFVKIVKACRFCLMCRHECTVGNITYNEAHTPRGQALMLDCFGSEALEDTEENRKRMAEILFECCYCGHCQNNCVSSYRHPDMIMAARANVKEEDLPGQVKELRERVSQTGKIFERQSELAGIVNDIFQKAGAGDIFLAYESGMGMDAYVLGMPEKAQEILDAGIKKIAEKNPERVVTISPEGYRAITGDIPGMDASGLKTPVIGFMAFMNELVKDGKLKLVLPKELENKKVAYHDGDQSGRFLQDFDTPRELIKSIQGIDYMELFWSKGEAASAGESGAISFLNEGLADEIARKRIEQVQGRGIDILVTDITKAKAKLEKAAGNDIQILHIAELVNMSI
jgi:Fe-S oxidoreductase